MSDSFSLVEQAVYSVKMDSRQNVVNLVQSSSGAAEEDLRLASEFATRVALWNGRFDSNNMFSFFLPNGTVLIGRLTPHGEHLPQDGYYYFQCLFADFELFCNAGADPLMFMHLSLNTTQFGLYRPRTALSSFRLAQKAPLVNIDSIRKATQKIGRKTLAIMVQSILAKPRLFFVSKQATPALVSAVFSLFPVHARRNLSFSLGVYFRGEPPRFFCVKPSDSQRLVLPKMETPVACLDLDALRTTEDWYELNDSWGILIDETLASGIIEHFLIWVTNHYLMRLREHGFDYDGNMSREEVDELGNELLSALNDPSDEDEEFSQRLEDEYESDYNWSENSGYEHETSFEPMNTWQKEEDERDGEEWKSADDKRDDWNRLADSIVGESKDEPDSVNTIRIFQIEPETRADASQESLASQINPKREFSDDLGGRVENPFEATTFEEQFKLYLDEQKRCTVADSDLETFEADEIQNMEDEARRFGLNCDETADGVRINLSPFALLSAEFPENNVVLRRLNLLVHDVCKGNLNSQIELDNFWKDFITAFEPDFIERVRREYWRYLEMLIDSSDDPEVNCSRTLGALDVFQILSD